MKLKNEFDCFISGFNLANKSLILYFLAALLNLQLVIPKTSFLLIFFLTLFGIAFSFALPIFLNVVYNRKTIDPQFFVKNLLLTLKRLIIPILSLLILYIIFSFFMFVFIVSYFGFKFDQTISILSASFTSINTVVVVTLVTSLLIFKACFFSIKHQSFFRSLWNSLLFSLRNYKFFFLIFLYCIFFNFLSFYFLNSSSWVLVIRALILVYVNLVLNSVVFLYFQKNI